MTNLKLLTSLCKFCWPTFWSTQQLEVKKKMRRMYLEVRPAFSNVLKKPKGSL